MKFKDLVGFNRIYMEQQRTIVGYSGYILGIMFTDKRIYWGFYGGMGTYIMEYNQQLWIMSLSENGVCHGVPPNGYQTIEKIMANR